MPPQIISKVAQGDIDVHRIEQAVGGDCDRAVRIRRQALERLRCVFCWFVCCVIRRSLFLTAPRKRTRPSFFSQDSPE